MAIDSTWHKMTIDEEKETGFELMCDINPIHYHA